MKALLVDQGHQLYAEIWSDQPPLLTELLAQWFRWFGPSLTASRVLVLLFSALLLWAFYQTIRLAASEPAALVSVALLVLSSYYVRMSMSVMVGLPAIALALVSLYLLVLAQRAGRTWLMVVSGIIFGLSIQTKLFTALLVPVILIYSCFLNETGTRPEWTFRQRLGRCVLWSAAMGLTFIVTGLLWRSLDPRQLIVPHLGEQTRIAYASGSNLAYVAERLSAHVGYLPFAIAGAWWGLKRRIPTVFLALGWLVVALSFLMYEKPLWYHYFLFMAVPLTWLGGLGIEAALRVFGLLDSAGRPITPVRLRHWARSPGVAVVGGLLVFDLVSRGYRLPNELPFRSQNQRLVDRLRQAACAKPEWVFSDRPIYAFEVGLAMPPPAAVISAKRLVSGELTEDMLLSILHSYRPKYVALERHFLYFSQQFKETLGQDYALLEEYRDNDNKDVVAQLLVARPLDTGSGAVAARVPGRVVFDSWLTLEWIKGSITDHIEAGGCLGVPDLMWQRPVARSGLALGLSLRLLDKAGNILAQHDEPLGTDFNTIIDRAELPYVMSLSVPEGTAPGEYDLALVVYDPQTGQPLKATGAAGTASGDGAVLGQVRVDQPARAPPIRAALADFGPVRLVTADSPATTVSPGGTVPLDLLWQADAEHHGESLVVVAQLLDEQGKVVAGLEEEPLNGRYGTAEWQPGELVRDRHTLSVPAGTPPGRYDLIVGLYRLPSRERLRTSGGLLGLKSRDDLVLRQIKVR